LQKIKVESPPSSRPPLEPKVRGRQASEDLGVHTSQLRAW
jgi:hypothetical protein